MLDISSSSIYKNKQTYIFTTTSSHNTFKMKFSTNAVVALFTVGAYSAAIETRDAKAVEGVIAAVQSKIDGLTSAAQSFSGSIQPVLDASNALIDSITAGTTTVQGSSNLSVSEALAIVAPVKELRTHAQTLDDEVKGKISTIESVKGCGLTRTQLGKISDDAHALIDAIVAKVPAAVQGVAKDQASKITAILDDAKAAVAEGKCNDA